MCNGTLDWKAYQKKRLFILPFWRLKIHHHGGSYLVRVTCRPTKELALFKQMFSQINTFHGKLMQYLRKTLIDFKGCASINTTTWESSLDTSFLRTIRMLLIHKVQLNVRGSFAQKRQEQSSHCRGWGGRVRGKPLSANTCLLQLLCSYIFMPFSFMMGVDWQDSFMVAKLIGYKTFFNEFVAYDHLSKLINLRKAAGPKFVNGVQQYMSVCMILYHINTSRLLLCLSGTWATAERNSLRTWSQHS